MVKQRQCVRHTAARCRTLFACICRFSCVHTSTLHCSCRYTGRLGCQQLMRQYRGIAARADYATVCGHTYGVAHCDASGWTLLACSVLAQNGVPRVILSRLWQKHFGFTQHSQHCCPRSHLWIAYQSYSGYAIRSEKMTARKPICSQCNWHPLPPEQT